MHAAVFGSVARGEAGPGSDIDILVDIDYDAHIGLIAFVGLQMQLTELLGHRVDLVSRGGLRPKRDCHSNILREAVEAF